MESVLADLRHAARSLSREPGFVATALLALALGIGANVAIFSVIEAVLLRPLPFHEPERLVAIWDVNAARGASHVPPSPGNFVDWEKETAHFSGMAVWYGGRATLRGAQGAEAIQVVKATPGFLQVLGTPPLLGRIFRSDQTDGAIFNVADMNLGGDRELVLSEALWRRRFGSDPGIVGSKISIDGADWLVLGVMPSALSVLTGDADAFLPWDVRASYATLPAGTPRDFRFVNAVARLADGVTLEKAEARMRTLASALAAAHPKENKGWSVSLAPLAVELRGPVRGPILLLFGATVFVLVTACANVASLQVARAAARARENAVRMALGASRGQLFRRFLAEGVLLSAAGSILGLLVAWGGIEILVGLQPWKLPSVGAVALDVPVLLFALTAGVVTAIAFGVAPAAGISPSLAATLAHGGRGASPGRPRTRLRRALVSFQVAACLVLLAGAGLFARSFAKARAVRPGFDPERLLVLRISLDKATYMSGLRSAVFYDTLVTRLAALPGVESAAGVTALPMSKVGVDFARPYWREGEPDPMGQAPRAAIRMATPRYFETLGMTVLRGRAFTNADRRGAPIVVAVNETLARRTFGGGDPVGKRLILDYKSGPYPFEIVGLVNDTRFGGLKSEPVPEIYIPHLQNPYLDMNVVVRTKDSPRRLAAAARKTVAELDPGQPVHSVVTMEELVGESIAEDRFFVALFGLLSAVALVLAATGVYGLLAFLVSLRVHEIGVRLALGARPVDVQRLVLSESAGLAFAGVAAGLGLALAFGRFAEGLLFRVAPTDPIALAGVALLLGATVLAASALPARAASRIEPLEAMRET